MQVADLLISGKYILTMESDTVLKDAGVVIKGHKIADVDALSVLKRRWQPQKELHYENGLIMPGLINAHTHIAMTLFRGMADDLPLMDWLQKHIFPVEARLRPQWVYWGSLLGCVEMIRSGTTGLCDMYLFSDEVAKAVAKSGLRAVVGEVLYDFLSPNYGELENGFRYTKELIEKWQGHPLIDIAVMPHAVYTCSPELLKRAKALADSYQRPLVIHLSETTTEVSQVFERYGVTPVGLLKQLGLLDNRLIAAHCVWLNDQDIADLKAADVGLVHNPESNLKLASGIAPLPRLLKEGLRIGLGTDGPASNNDLDMFLEMDTAAKIHKLQSQEPTVVSALEVLPMATRMGANVLGWNDVGCLKPGFRADLIVIDLNKPHLMPLYDPISHLVYAATGQDVMTTIVDGRILMQDGQILSLDVEEIFYQVGNIVSEIKGLRASLS